MKTLLPTIALLFAVSAQADVYEDAKQYINEQGKVCEEITHIQQLSYGSITVYDVTCKQSDSHMIYQFAPKQLVSTHYISQ